MVRQRVRIRFCKQGDLRWIGHRDLMRCLERLFRRARLPLGMTEGFHPKPRMAFPLALAVGIESLDEVMELELSEHRTAEELLPPLCAEAPPGLAFASVVAMPEGSRKAQAHHVAYEAVIPPDCRRGLAERIDGLMARGSCPVRRPNRAESIDLRSQLESLVLRGDRLALRLRNASGAKASPRDVLAALGLTESQQQEVALTRVAVEVSP